MSKGLSYRSSQRTAMLLGACLLAAGLSAPIATAQASGDPAPQHNLSSPAQPTDKYEGKLGEVSQHLLDAAQALDRAQVQLADAREDLARARGELVAAAAMDAQMQQKLNAAVKRLARSRSALRHGTLNVARQRAEVAAVAVDQFEGRNPLLLNLAAMLDAGSVQEMSNQLTAVDDVLDQGADNLSQLQATRVLLDVQERELAAAQRLVAERRDSAARHLLRSHRAERRAAAEKRSVVQLVDSRRASRYAAQQAVRRERQRLAALRQQRSDTSRLLIQQSQQLAGAAYTGATDGYLDAPVAGPITSPYGMRMHPILHIMELHDGTDIGAACGTPVHAAAPGSVLSSYRDDAYGNRVIVQHGFVHGVSLATSYNHLSGVAVAAGEHLQRGDVVGFVGATGYATGCHLHFMVYVNGLTVDPMTWLSPLQL